MAVLAGVGGVAAIVAVRPDGSACLSDPAVYPDTANVFTTGMPRELDIEDLPAQGTVIASGDPLALGDHEVSVLGVEDLGETARMRAEDGRRLVSVLVRERNSGDRDIIPQAGNHAWLCDTDGTWYQHDRAMTGMLAGPARLGPREKTVEKVVFQIRAGAQPSRVRTVSHGYRSQTLTDWELDRGWLWG